MVLINGSPRTDGRIARWIATLASEARLAGFETKEFTVATLSVAPCTGCMACRSTGHCRLPEDGAQAVLHAMQEAGTIVIGAPCYWGNIPGQLKTLFDRMVYGMMGEDAHGFPTGRMRGKNSVIVTTCSTAWPFNRLLHQSQGTVRALREILRWSGIRTVATVQQGGTRHRAAFGRPEEARCRRIIKHLQNR